MHRTPCGGIAAVFTPDWEELDLGLSPFPTRSATELLSKTQSGVSQSIKAARDPAHLVATTAGAVGSRAGLSSPGKWAGATGSRTGPSSPGRRAGPRRDDSALEGPGQGSWLMRTQGKAAALAANVGRKASDMMEQWSESQLSTRTIWPQ